MEDDGMDGGAVVGGAGRVEGVEDGGYRPVRGWAHPGAAATSCARFSWDGRAIAAGCTDNRARLFSPFSQDALHELEGHTRPLTDVAWSCDNRYVVSGSDDATARVWDVMTGKEACPPLVGHSQSVFAVDVSPRGNVIATGSYDESVRLFDPRARRCHRVIAAHSEPVTSVQFNPDGTILATGSYDGLTRLWDVASGQCLLTVHLESIPPVTCVRFTPNGRYVLVTTMDGRIRLWDYLTHSVLKVFKGHAPTTLAATTAWGLCQIDRPLVLSGSGDGSVHAWHLQSGTHHAIVPSSAAVATPIVGIDAHPDCDAFLTVAAPPNTDGGAGGGADGVSLRLWSVMDGAWALPTGSVGGGGAGE